MASLTVPLVSFHALGSLAGTFLAELVRPKRDQLEPSTVRRRRRRKRAT